MMGPRLMELAQKENVYLYPASDLEKLEQLIEGTDLYLDINYGGAVDGVLDSVIAKEIPIFAFYKTQNGDKGQYLFAIKNVDAMIDAIRSYAETKQLPNKSFDFEVQTIDETLDYILEHQSSIARFGDGEAAIMLGQSINYQHYDPQLAEELKFIFKQQSNSQLVIGLQEGIKNRFNFVPEALAFWRQYLEDYEEFYLEYCHNPWYGSTFISRPYIDFLDKSKSKSQFEKLKTIWEGRDILIVEGYTSRSGVGNDLFDGAKSIKRIICPSRNAYSKKAEIIEEILKYSEGRLILLMLGPTAKVLAYQLASKGLQAIDIGHIDSEYEWMQMGAEKKVLLRNKHTAEFNLDTEIELANDDEYLSQIVADLSEE
ncbi:SP_1767 family glycosyltransferase [Streptococcus pneumoniae]